MTKPTGADYYIQRMIDRDIAQTKAEIARLEKQLRRAKVIFAVFVVVCLMLFALNALQLMANYPG